MRQNNQTRLHLGQTIGFEFINGTSFLNQSPRICGIVHSISHYVQGFVIVIISMDPQVFRSAIYLAIPCHWITLPPLSALYYWLAYHSLPTPPFNHLLDQSHVAYQSDQLQHHLEGSRLCTRSRWHVWKDLFLQYVNGKVAGFRIVKILALSLGIVKHVGRLTNTRLCMSIVKLRSLFHGTTAREWMSKCVLLLGRRQYIARKSFIPSCPFAFFIVSWLYFVSY